MATRTPGICARHAIITPNCRTIPRPQYDPDPALAAFDEASARLREEYAAICTVRNDDFRAHVVLTIEGPPSGEEMERDLADLKRDPTPEARAALLADFMAGFRPGEIMAALRKLPSAEPAE